ncbi:MAG: alpha/beta hydrolase [Hamadaea sp.]|uniref:alpha/beta hydrolase n=1 Tax=Hamadaea sp. TaxID=2024425 RepID=UPI0017E0AC4E|nr:alpha/beta hydrolase [Hamadaea sp.]NUT21161.1 alpha/beta hydrolase [Hamadaea sp.]
MDRIAVVFPGGQFGPYTALLTFAAEAAELRGARILPHMWTRPDEPPTLALDERMAWVTGEANPVLDRIATESPGATPLVIAKSLGTCVIREAAERGLPGVWLTPLFNQPEVVAEFRRAKAPMLLIGGTADHSWNGELARELSPHVLEIPDADHGLFVPGRLAASAEVLGRVATAVEDFLDTVIWPS